jgi:hypothetical protein
MAESALSFGVEHVDLGGGQEDYKHRFANRSIKLATGCVDLWQWRMHWMRIAQERLDPVAVAA